MGYIKLILMGLNKGFNTALPKVRWVKGTSYHSCQQ